LLLIVSGMKHSKRPKPVLRYLLRCFLGDTEMAKQIVITDDAPKSAAYSQAVKAAGLIFVSGQGPFDAKSGEVVGATIQEQTAQCLKNIETILQAANSSLDKIVSATFILAEESDFTGMNEEWMKWFPTNPPARQGSRLPICPKGMKISIAVIAEG
jgi:2-iminobutanoate/2-iminopropanoate deaminase